MRQGAIAFSLPSFYSAAIGYRLEGNAIPLNTPGFNDGYCADHKESIRGSKP